MPPQWRQPSAPAPERFAGSDREAGVAAPQAPLPVGYDQQIERDDTPAEPVTPDRDTPAPMIAVKTADAPDESAGAPVPEETSADQARRRGWWRRLIE